MLASNGSIRRQRRASKGKNKYFNAILGFVGFTILYFLMIALIFPDTFRQNHRRMLFLSSSGHFINNNNNQTSIVKNIQRDYLKRNKLPPPPITFENVVQFLSHWLHTLHNDLTAATSTSSRLSKGHDGAMEIWDIYYKLAIEMLVPWDKDYLERMPPRRDDDSIFLSVATYRDENCPNTLSQAYSKAKYPQRLFVGLVQQNCYANCKSGVTEDHKIVNVEPDVDCQKVFCNENPHYCKQVRTLHVNETESLGPYMARFMASKLWDGEPWYMQIDAHMTFLQDWDAISIGMLKRAPSSKPVISHYPPGHKMDLVAQSKKPGGRLCGPAFTNIIRLEGLKKWDTIKIDIPRFAPFAAAGYFVAHSEFLRDVPFDPFLPWIFMGEEIIMSSRLWTSGYDMFSPSQSVVGHMYVRKHKPKFWETVTRVLKGRGRVYDDLEEMVLERIKYQLGYPESTRDILGKEYRTVLSHVGQYSMGKTRKLADYMKLAGIDVMRKEMTQIQWCEKGKVAPGSEQYTTLYEEAERKALSKRNNNRGMAKQ